MFARVVVDVAPAHLDRPFDYRIPDGLEVTFGSRVRVMFHGRRRTGWVVDLVSEPAAGLARVADVLAVEGPVPWFDEADLEVARWIAGRYVGTTADVLRHALPARVVRVEQELSAWPPPVDRSAAERPPCADRRWRGYTTRRDSRTPGPSGVAAVLRAAWAPDGSAHLLRPGPREDVAALVIDLVSRCTAGGRRSIVVVPSPTDEVADAVLGAFPEDGVDVRGGVDDAARYRAFLRLRTRRATVAVGERAAALLPVPDLGLVVVLDEANPAYKERRSPRHHAREAALARARLQGAACVLVTDLPSAHAWRHHAAGHLPAVVPDRQRERAAAPRVDVVDRTAEPPSSRRGRLADRTAHEVADAVRAGGTVVVLAARRGQGAALSCRGCGTLHRCGVCTAAIRPAPVGAHDDGWLCAVCGWHGPARPCPECGAHDVAPLAAGAGRLAAELTRAHPRAEVVRMEGFDAVGPATRPGIAVMTRGSVVRAPAWLRGERADLVIEPDADALLVRPRVDAAEDALRVWLAAGRWADRFVVQTRQARSPVVQALMRWDPDGFWRGEAQRRAPLGFPPARTLVRITAPPETASEVAITLRGALPTAEVLGPDPDGAVLVKVSDLRGTLATLRPLRSSWDKDGRRVRIDVDP